MEQLDLRHLRFSSQCASSGCGIPCFLSPRSIRSKGKNNFADLLLCDKNPNDFGYPIKDLLRDIENFELGIEHGEDGFSLGIRP